MTYVYLAVALALTSVGGWLGYTFMDGKVQRAETRAEAADELSRQHAKATKAELVKERIVTKYVDRVITIPGEVREVIKEVPAIACVNTNTGRAQLDSSFRVLHDQVAAAATRTYAPPGPADGAAVAPQAVTPEEVLTGVADNYAACALNAAKLTALQEYVLGLDAR